jgi:hypothetical protein
VHLTLADIATAVARYSERLHAEAGARHHVASPLGAWLLLAVAATAAKGPERAALADVLGVDPQDAAVTARELLANPHPMVGAAAGAWHRPKVATDALAAWLQALPEVIETGEMPTQHQIDQWAREHTLGLIERFPLELTDDTVLLLASALATRVSWLVPFDLAPGAALGVNSSWSAGLTNVLRTPGEPWTGRSMHDVHIASTTRAGDVAVHTARAQQEGSRPGVGVHVISVIAAPDVAPTDVLAAAYELAIDALHSRAVSTRSLFDLPLGDGAAWTITEEPAGDRRVPPERFSAVLPAWSADSDHELLVPALGFPAAAAALIDLLPPDGYQSRACQRAVARYDRVGFEAAAITGLAISTSAPAFPPGARRSAEVRFGHPFAVVAVTSDLSSGSVTGEQRSGPWHGVPVFSAWITDPDDADGASG